ncbi:UNVERIFIED_CONTAM: hypothetical protein K2H54_040436 [Gekko kuhli]
MGSKEFTKTVEGSEVTTVEGKLNVEREVVPILVAGVVALVDVLLLASDVMRLDGMEVMVGSEEGTEVVEGRGVPSVEETADVGNEEVSMVDTSAVDEE